jgi:hypothetical protein
MSANLNKLSQGGATEVKIDYKIYEKNCATKFAFQSGQDPVFAVFSQGCDFHENRGFHAAFSRVRVAVNNAAAFS